MREPDLPVGCSLLGLGVGFVLWGLGVAAGILWILASH